MSRKASIDRLLRVNATSRIPSLRVAFANRCLRDADDLLYADIKSVLENLRSVLDYTFHDLVAIIPTVSSPGSGDTLYFPFAHPITKAGKAKSRTDILNDFAHKRMVPELKRYHPSIYGILLGVQGEQWLSDLIKSVNDQKHNDTVKLGEKWMHINPDGINPVVKAGEGVVFENCTFAAGGNTLKPGKIGASLPVPSHLKPFIRIIEEGADSSFDAWINRLAEWNINVTGLINVIYAHYPV